MATPTMTVPRNSEELAEMLADSTKRKEIFASPQSTQEFMDAYRETAQGENTEVHKAVAESLAAGFAELLKDNGKEIKDQQAREAIKRLDLDPQAKRKGGMLTSHRKGTAHNPTAPGAQVDKHFEDSIDYVRSIWHKNPTPDADKLGALRNAAGSVSPADGGFLVPETLRSQLLQLALEKAVVRPLATVVPMESARVPFPMIDSTTNAGSVFGGMVAYWGEEGAALQDSNPKFGRVELDAKKLTGLSAVPNELLQDSIVSFSALIETLWPQALAFEEDNKFQSGSGTGEPLGFRGAGNPAAVTVTRANASKIQYVDVIGMYARMLPASLSNAVWMCAPDALPQLLQLSLTVGTGGNSVFVVNAAAGMPMSIFGRPLIITEKGSALGSRGDLAFVDLSYYLVGDRQVMTADSSTDYNFGTDKTTFRIIQRVDGRPWIQSPITPANGSTATLSPFVELL